jgi:hypothetical protein
MLRFLRDVRRCEFCIFAIMGFALRFGIMGRTLHILVGNTGLVLHKSSSHKSYQRPYNEQSEEWGDLARK